MQLKFLKISNRYAQAIFHYCDLNVIKKLDEILSMYTIEIIKSLTKYTSTLFNKFN